MKKKRKLAEAGYERPLWKIFKVMKLTFVLMFVLAFELLAIHGKAQSEKVTVNQRNSAVREVLDVIEKQCEYKFFYNAGLVDVERKVTIQATNEQLVNVLRDLFEGTDVSYRIIENNIILSNLIKNPKNVGLNQNQQQTISGKVTDHTGDPLPGVNVFEKSQPTNGVITGIDGTYSIQVTSSEAILSYSYIGFEGQEVQVAGRETIDITLLEETTGLDEVVVVAYGTQKRETMTSAVSTVNLDGIDSKPITDLSQAIAGMAAGVTAIQGSSQPGASGATIRIRGTNTLGDENNTPLVIIDGAIGGSLNDVNPTDVESISMLKDASSTAMYGARAAAGVILITTKRAKAGKVSLSYDGYVGFDKATELPDVISNSADYMELLQDYTNDPSFPPNDLIDEFRNDGGQNPLMYPNTNWYKEILGGTATMHSHNISLRGGTEKARVAASINYLDQDGLVINTSYKRLGFRLNFDSQISEKLNIGMNLSGKNGMRESPGGNINQVISHIHSTVPYVVPQHPDGRFGGDGFTSSGAYNPILSLKTRYQEREINTFTGKIFGSYEILPRLVFTTSANMFQEFQNSKNLQKAWQRWDFTDDTVLEENTINSLTESNNRHRIITVNTLLNYDFTIGELNNFALLAGYSQEENRWDTSWSYGRGLADESIFVMDGPQDQASFLIGGNKTLNNLRSYFGRLNYDFDGKYLLEASFRYDGSSKFREDKRWGFFPSASAGWNIHRENFMENVSFITTLKLRASAGEVGNNASLGNYSYISTLQFGADYPFNDMVSPGIYLNELANPDLIWENTTTYGLGLDFGLFNNQLTGEFDVYKNRTDGILRKVTAPLFGGIPNPPYENLAVVDSKGFELALNYKNFNKAFKYSVGLTLSHSSNEIVSFNDGQFQEIDGNFINKVGYPINSIYTYEADGLFRSQEEIDDHAEQARPPKVGDLRYKDQNNDGVIDADDRVIMDPAVPKINAGLNLNFSYKNLDLNILMQGAFGSKDFVRTAPARPFAYPGRGITGKEWLNAFHETDNPNSDIPRLDETSGNYIASTYWMHSFDFIRFRTIQLGYNLPKGTMEHIGIERGRIYVNGQNLFTIEDVPHYDPESVGEVYPLTKTITVGVQLTF
jgi:TonB-linked SusC/RagA family outer membrane protein